MTTTITRRQLTQVAAVAALATSPLVRATGAAAQEEGLRFGPAEPFSFDLLITRAKEMAAVPYVPPPRPDPAIVGKIDYDAYGKIGTKWEDALYAQGPGVFPIVLKHVGMFFPKTVRMHAVSDGMAREVLYSDTYFNMTEDHVAHGLGEQPSAFAGFWVYESRLDGDWSKREPWVTFLGASYFRAVGELGQVGQSARGLAIGTGDPEPEEFPDFVAHWFQPAMTDSDPVIVHSLLDSPSISGAYRFALHRTKGVVMDIECRLFPRKEIPHIGIAPLTSMYWYGEADKGRYVDWRPEVHDADGLAIWNGAGEHLWRPLNNPPRIVTSSFFDTNPRGFGLSQRDRNYDHYLEGVGYHLRPSTWVEPLGQWGRGVVRLVEIPTDDEIYDNIVAFWVPEVPPKAGDELAYAYRLHWMADEPFAPKDLARVHATAIGRGGQPGRARPKGVYKFMVDFAGGPLPDLPDGTKIEPDVSVSVGEISLIHMEKTPFTERERVTFDLTAPPGSVVEMRLLFRVDGKPITETWLFQFHVPAA
ncbi:MAG: glucan biosynthesis protein D [Geminicoccaceae bacterium]